MLDMTLISSSPAPENPGQRLQLPNRNAEAAQAGGRKSSPVLTATGRNIWKCSTARNSTKSSSGRKLPPASSRRNKFTAQPSRLRILPTKN